MILRQVACTFNRLSAALMQLQVYGMMEDLAAKQSFLTKLKDAQTGKEADKLRSNEGQDGWLDPWTQKAEWWEPPITDSSKEQSEDNLLNGIAAQPVSHLPPAYSPLVLEAALRALHV